MDVFTQIVLTVGRIMPDHVAMLGTAFFIREDGLLATTHHVTGNDDRNLCVLFPRVKSLNEYQDMADNSCTHIPARIVEVDPIRDICILKTDAKFQGTMPKLSSFDGHAVGEEIEIFGFPHCVEGRRVLTYQRAEIGAKVLIENNGIKSKHAVINVQARPGQSGSPIFSPKSRTIAGMLVGAWVPGVFITLGNINPAELHQTTQCISVEYIQDML